MDKQIMVAFRDLMHTEDILRRHLPEDHPAWEAVMAALNIERCELQIEASMRILDRNWIVPHDEEWMTCFEEYWQ